VSLSEQQLVDCDTEDSGCNGGWPYLAIDYVASNGGIDTEDSYSYEATVSHAFIMFFFQYIYPHCHSVGLYFFRQKYSSYIRLLRPDSTTK